MAKKIMYSGQKNVCTQMPQWQLVRLLADHMVQIYAIDWVAIFIYLIYKIHLSSTKGAQGGAQIPTRDTLYANKLKGSISNY